MEPRHLFISMQEEDMRFAEALAKLVGLLFSALRPTACLTQELAEQHDIRWCEILRPLHSPIGLA